MVESTCTNFWANLFIKSNQRSTNHLTTGGGGSNIEIKTKSRIKTEKRKSLESRKKTKSKLIHLPGQKQVKVTNIHTHTHTHTPHTKAEDDVLNQNDTDVKNLWTKSVWQKMWFYQQFSEEKDNGISVNVINCTSHQTLVKIFIFSLSK